MKIGDELVSVNETSFKMIDLEQAIDVSELIFESFLIRENY